MLKDLLIKQKNRFKVQSMISSLRNSAVPMVFLLLLIHRSHSLNYDF